MQTASASSSTEATPDNKNHHDHESSPYANTASGDDFSVSSASKQCCRFDDMEIIDILKHPIWVFDVANKAMWWANQASLQIWKASTVKELLARDFATDMSQETSTRLLDNLERMKEGETLKEQWTYYPNGGEARTVKVAGSVIYIEDGKGKRAACLFEAQLPDHAEFNNNADREIEMLRHVPMPVCQAKVEDGEILFRNPEDLLVFGVNRASLDDQTSTTGSTTIEDKSGNDNNADTDNHQDSMRNSLVQRFVDKELGKSLLENLQKQNEYQMDAQLQIARGKARWFSLSARKSKDPVTSKDCILCSAKDITEVLKAREKTKQANLKSEFMSVIAHEIRTPLHQIVGYTDLLELDRLPDPQQVEAVKLIQRSLDNLMAILNDLLDYNKYERGETELEKLHFSMRGLLKGVTTTFQSEALVKGISIQLDLDPDIPMKLIGDPNKLRQIMLNLIQNAVKFTNSGGNISVAAKPISKPIHNGNDSRPQRIMRINVTDTGIGIDPSHQQEIFEKYAKVNVKKINYEGTGLGLAICKSLTEAMGGKIGVISELGKGTSFHVEIPFELPESSIPTTVTVTKEAAPQEADDELSVDRALRILVVEDNKVNQKLVCRMLTKLGHVPFVADDGQIALDMLFEDSNKKETIHVDLVLMDIQMPVLDGIDCTKEIRKRRTKLVLPIVGLSASYQNSDLEMYLDIGMNTCLSKPVRLDTLKKTIEKTITNCKSGRSSV